MNQKAGSGLFATFELAFFRFQRSFPPPPLNFPVNSLRCFLPHRRVFLFPLSTNGPFLHPTRPLFTPLPRSLLVHNSSSSQLPIRNRTAGIVKAKGDENAMSKHVRQGSGVGLGPSRSTTFGKNIRERPVLNEVTKTAINRKVASRLSFHGLC